ncbi:MAG TPA: PP2C family protein-serine/threonine phosphatase [Tepidisphaeraceae bacterium]|nr:PP2C family protein-serine/threonine phosphatase [Tepidisphaeraceae bacterium]
MQKAIRTFIGRVLLIHVALLLLLLAIVFFAARSVYGNAREHAINQATVQQDLLAAQTARAVKSFYDSILGDLQLLRPEDTESATPPAGSLAEPATQPALSLHGAIGASLLSRQLQGRASHLFTVDRPRLRIRWIGIEPSINNVDAPTPAEIVVRLGAWLRALKKPTIDSFVQFGDAGYSVVAVPYGAFHNMVLVAVVPAEQLQTLFLDRVNQSNSATLLLNDRLTAMAAFRPDLVGTNFATATDPELTRAINRYRQQGNQGTIPIARPFRIGPVEYRPALVTVEPMQVGGQTWFILISSPLGNADRVVAELFHEAVKWCIFLVVSITALLASTAVQLIRGRLRIEHERMEMIEGELKQARQIQLAWLPPAPGPADHNGHIDIATLNQPASHISGDFYNFFNLPDGRIVVSIGDVTGHGMAAAFLMATTQLLVRNTMPRVGGPADCLQEVNRQLCVQMFNGQFVTMQILVLDCAAGKVEVATAGHPAPLLSAGKSFVPMPLDPQLVMGVERDTHYRSQTFGLQSNWSILLYTDGVVEAERSTGERLGFTRLQSALRGAYPTAQELLDAAVQTVDQFRAGYALRDDLTLVAVQRPNGKA